MNAYMRRLNGYMRMRVIPANTRHWSTLVNANLIGARHRLEQRLLGHLATIRLLVDARTRPCGGDHCAVVVRVIIPQQYTDNLLLLVRKRMLTTHRQRCAENTHATLWTTFGRS